MAKLKVALRCLCSIALLGFVARKINWRDLGTILARIEWPWALLALLLGGLLIAALAFRWRIFLRQHQIALPFGQVLSLTWAGQFFNSFLPGTTGGDVFRIYQACRLAHNRKAAAAASVLTDRFSALVALLGMAVVAFLLEPAPVRALAGHEFSPPAFWGLCALGMALALLLWALWRRLDLHSWLGRLERTLAATLQGLLRPNKELAFAFALAFAIHLLNFFIIYLLARSLGISITYFQVLLMMPVVLLLVLLPLTINGHGLRELLLIAYFAQMSVHLVERGEIGYREVALALSLLMVATDLLWSLPGGLHYLARRNTRPPLNL